MAQNEKIIEANMAFHEDENGFLVKTDNYEGMYHEPVDSEAELRNVNTSDAVLHEDGALYPVKGVGIFELKRSDVVSTEETGRVVASTTGNHRFHIITAKIKIASGAKLQYNPATQEINHGTADHNFADLSAKPTTQAGYGITDVVNVSEKGSANGVADLDSNGKIPASQLYDIKAKSFENIAERNAWLAGVNIEEIYEGLPVYVTDASADPTVTGGHAVYRVNSTLDSFIKTSEGESLDIDFSPYLNRNSDTTDSLTEGVRKYYAESLFDNFTCC